MRRILVADDNPQMSRQAIGVSPRRHCFRVSLADSGIGGLAALARSTSPFLDPATSAAGLSGIAEGLGVARRLRKPLKPATLLGVIDAGLSGAELDRRLTGRLGAVVNAPSKSAEVHGRRLA